MIRLEHIGLDVDGVLRDLASHLVTLFERENPSLRGRALPIEHWDEFWGFDRYFPTELEFGSFRRKIMEELWLEAPIYPDVKPGLERLLQERTVHIVTAQPTPRTAELTRIWLERQGIHIPPERLHITSQKEEAPVQVLLDDMQHNLEAVCLAGRVGICRNQPWNRSYEGFRIAGMSELIELIERLEAG